MDLPGTRRLLKAIALFCFFLFFQISNLLSQKLGIKDMDLAKILNSKTEVGKIIDSQMIVSNITVEDKINEFHSLLHYNFNRVQVDSGVNYSIFDLPINRMFAYKNESDEFCLYLLMDINQTGFDTIAKHLGNADNVSAGDYISGDFDFLTWQLKEMEVHIFWDRMGMHNAPSTKKVVVFITNMEIEKLMSSEKVF